MADDTIGDYSPLPETRRLLRSNARRYEAAKPGRYPLQGGRKQHANGLFDIPICTVFDYGESLLTRNAVETKEFVKQQQQQQQQQQRQESVTPLTPVMRRAERGKRSTIVPSSSFSSSSSPSSLAHCSVDAPLLSSYPSTCCDGVEPGNPAADSSWKKSGLPRPRISWMKRGGRRASSSSSSWSASTSDSRSWTVRCSTTTDGPGPSGGTSRDSSRNEGNRSQIWRNSMDEEDSEHLVMEILCKVLAVDKTAAVRHWLLTASESDKDLVFEFARASLVPNSSDERRTGNKNGRLDDIRFA